MVIKRQLNTNITAQRENVVHYYLCENPKRSESENRTAEEEQ